VVESISQKNTADVPNSVRYCLSPFNRKSFYPPHEKCTVGLCQKSMHAFIHSFTARTIEKPFD